MNKIQKDFSIGRYLRYGTVPTYLPTGTYLGRYLGT